MKKKMIKKKLTKLSNVNVNLTLALIPISQFPWKANIIPSLKQPFYFTFLTHGGKIWCHFERNDMFWLLIPLSKSHRSLNSHLVFFLLVVLRVLFWTHKQKHCLCVCKSDLKKRNCCHEIFVLFGTVKVGNTRWSW